MPEFWLTVKLLVTLFILKGGLYRLSIHVRSRSVYNLILINKLECIHQFRTSLKTHLFNLEPLVLNVPDIVINYAKRLWAWPFGHEKGAIEMLYIIQPVKELYFDAIFLPLPMTLAFLWRHIVKCTLTITIVDVVT